MPNVDTDKKLKLRESYRLVAFHTSRGGALNPLDDSIADTFV